MSAMSASPVKPALPPTGVNVPPPVATSPPKVGMPITSTLTIAPSKPTNMNHTVTMPLSLIADHKLPPNYPQGIQTLPHGLMQPISQPLPRTPDKPKELPVPMPVAMSIKPTSNGMEGLVVQSQPPPATPAVPEVQISVVPPPSQKVEAAVAPAPEVPEVKIPQTQTLPENTTEPPPATAAPPVEPEAEKKEELAPVKPVEAVSETVAKIQPVPTPQETPASTTSTTPTPVTTTTITATAAATTPAAPPATVPTPALAPPPPPPAEQPIAPSVSRTSEVNLSHSKPEIKVATIPRQATKRKREPKVAPETPEVKKEGKDEDRKSKRVRLPTQPYQSPIPELNIIAKINKSSKLTPSKAADDKLIVFYKNEFLAVRNAEGGFYVCQAMQNIYKSSPRIRIRWLSLEEGKDTYSPDFYDHTDFDCILTNLNLDRIDKEKFRLPPEEQQRTESILKRALDVEKGVSEKPPVTEEHPDGLDLSLFRDESQLKKGSKNKSKSSSGKKLKTEGGESDEDENEAEDGDDDDDDLEEEEEEEKKAKKEKAPKSSKRRKKSAKKKPPPPSEKTKTAVKSTIQPAKKKTETRVGSKRKSSVSSNTQPPEKKIRKSDASSQPSDRTNKTRSAEAVVGAKTRRDRRAKSRK